MSSEVVNGADISFEDFGHENGIRYWWATDFMKFLGYPNLTSFIKPINRAMQACLAATIDTHDNFIKETRIVDGETFTDFKLTKFACYMVALNGDPKKPEIAKAQAYFAQQVEVLNLLLSGADDLERVLAREEIKEGNKSLMAAAKGAGVVNFAIFQDAGYRGMYNTGISNVAKMKGVEPKKLMDYMGRTELAANLFRITLTEENLRKRGVFNENAANEVHRNVGKSVRKMVIENTGVPPEKLKLERMLGDVKKELKKANKQLNEKNPSHEVGETNPARLEFEQNLKGLSADGYVDNGSEIICTHAGDHEAQLWVNVNGGTATVCYTCEYAERNS
jgi:DNA-damage-inducible protein D